MRGFPSLYIYILQHLVAQVFQFTPPRIRTKDTAIAMMSEYDATTPECVSDASCTQSLSSGPLTGLTVTEHAAVQTNMPRMNRSLVKGAQGQQQRSRSTHLRQAIIVPLFS